MCYLTRILLAVVLHRPGKMNVRADRLSHWKHDHTDIRLNPKVFHRVWPVHLVDHVDLFATPDNRLLDPFISWRPDPSAIAVDTFVFLLKSENPYCLPPPPPLSPASVGFSERHSGKR